MFITKQFKFDAAHNLTEYKGKCENLHGHTYKLEVTLTGEPTDRPNCKGMIMDFGDIKKIVNERVIDKLDHQYLNDVVPQSTAENIILWIWEQLEETMLDENHQLYELKLWETETSFVTYRRER